MEGSRERATVYPSPFKVTSIDFIIFGDGKTTGTFTVLLLTMKYTPY